MTINSVWQYIFVVIVHILPLGAYEIPMLSRRYHLLPILGTHNSNWKQKRVVIILTKKRNKTESAHVQQLDDHLNANETSVSSSFEQFQFTKRINFIPNWLLERQFMNINTFASQFLYKLLVLSLYLPLRLYLAILFDVILFEFNWNAAKLQNKESECDWDECKRLMQYRS